MRRSQCLVALRSARGGGSKKKGGGGVGGTVLIAHGQRNPITVGIDYKIVCVNDFHAESGRLSPEQGKKKRRVKLGNKARLCHSKENSSDNEAKSEFK